MDKYINLITNNMIIRVVFVAIFLDTFLGCLRALKERKFNSCVGIDGAIRKVAMVVCVVILLLVDTWFNFNLIGFLPVSITEFLHVSKIGLAEFFSILFVVYEMVSIMKNMVLCGLPIKKSWKEKLEKLLNLMTDEMPKE
ncbi:MAG: phage holin family protein [Clostridium sp.]